jgi:hypothetical protein
MRIAVTFCDESEHECRGNEHDNSCLSRGEAESLPQFIECEMPGVLNHELLGTSSLYSCVADTEADDFSDACSFCRARTKTER